MVINYSLCYNFSERGKIMIQTILSTIITALVSGILGYCVSTIKKYREKIKTDKEKENIQNVALRTILKNQLTNTYYVYNEMKRIPDYMYQNFLDLLEVYEKLGGNSYIHTIAHKMENWEISKTDIL